MDDTFDIKKRNKEIAKKIARVEKRLSSLNIIEFFEGLLRQVENEFGISLVWISIINSPSMLETIRASKSSAYFSERMNILEEKTFFELTSNSVKPVLVNENLRPFYRLLPRDKKYLIRSLAMVPIRIENQIIGSLNLGDFSKERYQPDMDTTLLQSFADSVSLRLSEIVARERLSEPQNATK